MSALQVPDASGSSPKPRILSGHTRMVYSIAFMPDDTQFVSGSMDGTIRTWSSKQGREIRSPIDCKFTVSAMAISNDGRWIATGSCRWRVALWDAVTHDKVCESSDGHLGPVECLDFSANSTMVVSGGGEGTVTVWRVPTGEKLAGPFRGHVDSVTSVIFSPDGGQLASADFHDIRIRDRRSGTLVLPVIQMEARSLVWATQPKDSAIFAACGNQVKCIDASTGAVSLEWTAHPLTITCLALSRDGQTISVSSNYARTVQVWSTETQQELVPPLQHGSFVLCAAVSVDGSHVITGTEDHAVYIWPIRVNAEPATQSTAKIVAIDDSDDPEDTVDRAIRHTVERFSRDLTNQVTRDTHDPVASGGFADIYRGMLQENGKSIRVAIKAIKTYSGEDSDFSKKQKRLRREIKVWLKLTHANILPLLGTTLGFGHFPSMVCPWVENGALTSYLHDHYQTLSMVAILNLLSNVASGLRYLHSHSVVHGDLSGSNVLIRENGMACISDFGLSMLLTELGGSTFSTSFHARGTLRWTAPELLDLEVPEDDAEEEPPHLAPTTQSDVYSFGGVMLQILSGKVPYHYYTREAQVVHAVSRGMTPKRPSSALVTERRWTFIRQCWSTTEIVHSRPSSSDIVQFTEEELAGAATS